MITVLGLRNGSAGNGEESAEVQPGKCDKIIGVSEQDLDYSFTPRTRYERAPGADTLPRT